MRKLLPTFAVLAGAMIGSAMPAAGHTHFYTGVVDSNGNQTADAGDKLLVTNPPAANEIFDLTFRLSGETYGGYYALKDPDADYFTFASLTLFDESVASSPYGHAAPNANIYLQIVTITGPAGGSFGFWEGENPQVPEEDQDHSGGAYTTPSISFLANTPTGNFSLAITERYSFESPPFDPGGHIHGRAWTVTQPGDYFVTFKLVDTAGIQADSDPFVFHFQAVPEPSGAMLLAMGTLLVGQCRRRKWNGSPAHGGR